MELGDFVDVDIGDGGGPPKTEAVEQGPLVHVDRQESAEEGGKEIGIVDPDRLLNDGITKDYGEQEELDGAEDGGEEKGERAKGDRREEPTAPPFQIRKFTGTAALALAPERGQRLDRLDLEVQIRPQSPNGMILYAATTPMPYSSKEAPRHQQIVHNLELANGQPKYTFRVGGEIYEVLLADRKVPMDQWSTLRIVNDGQGRASIRINSGAPNELFYDPSRMPTQSPGTPVRIFVGGTDPRIPPGHAVNFIGAIGRVRLNQKNLDLAEGKQEGARRMEGKEGDEGETRLDQQENQCSREPCRNGGQCRLERFGGFQCQCKGGFAGRLCEFPSTDGVCPHDGRWCHRGICIWRGMGGPQQQFPFECLCPPNWRGQRCERFVEEEDAEGIRFDGKHSFLAIPLGQQADGDEEADGGRGFSVEFRLSPEMPKASSASVEQQLVAVLVGMDSAETAAVIGIEAGRLWTLQRQEGNQPATKRFLSKRIKAKKTHRIRLEQSGPGEIRLLVSGKPKGTIPSPDGHWPPLLLLGGMPPRGMNISGGMLEHLPKEIGHFEGCLDGLSVNGRKLGWRDVAKMNAANLAKCQPRGEAKASEEEEAKMELPPPTPPLPTAFPAPYTPLPVVSVSEDPLLAEQEAADWTTMGPEGEPIDGTDEERKVWEPIQLTGTISPDPLPSSTDRPRIWPTKEEEGETTEQMGESAEILSTVEPTTEEPMVEETTPMPTISEETKPTTTKATISEEPSTEWFTTSIPSSIDSTTSPWSIEEEEEEERTTLMPVPAKPTPTWMIGPDSAELEGPFPGLCEAKTCGPHGECEEINATHVLCACRDYWVGQTCDQFRPIEYAASFDGSAFVVFSSDEFPHLISDREEVVEFKLRTRARYGLIFWQGQQPALDEDGVEDFDLSGEDFLSIGLLDGHLAFSYELGGGAAQLISEAPVNDGRPHLIRAVRKGRNGTLQVDGGTLIRGRSSGILAMLNVEGHIFVGGVPDLHLMTAGIHTQNFVGCLAELALNGYRLDLMGHAIDGRNVRPCREWRPKRLRRRRQWMRMMRRRQRMRKATALNRTD